MVNKKFPTFKFIKIYTCMCAMKIVNHFNSPSKIYFICPLLWLYNTTNCVVCQEYFDYILDYISLKERGCSKHPQYLEEFFLTKRRFSPFGAIACIIIEQNCIIAIEWTNC